MLFQESENVPQDQFFKKIKLYYEKKIKNFINIFK